MDQFVTSCLSLGSLLFLSILIWGFLRDYRIDAFRQELFKIRDELFDFAAAGNISFEDPAYGALRRSLNSLIRFAHRLTLSRALFSAVTQGISPNQVAAKSLERYYAPLNQLANSYAKERLSDLHTKTIIALTKFLVTGSPLLLAFIFYFAFKLLTGAASKLRATVLNSFSKHVPGLYELEAQAIRSDASQSSENQLVPA